MTFEIALVLGILAVALVLFITEWLRMDVVALLVLSVLALTGLVDSEEAIAGFSNPAVITVWAMFILSDDLTRARVSDVIGRNVLRFAGRGQASSSHHAHGRCAVRGDEQYRCRRTDRQTFATQTQPYARSKIPA